MFLNKVKEQQEKNPSFPHPSASHYQTALLTIPTTGAKTDGGGQSSGPPHHPPHSNQNMLPVPSTGIMTAGELFPSLPLSPKWEPFAPANTLSLKGHKSSYTTMQRQHVDTSLTGTREDALILTLLGNMLPFFLLLVRCSACLQADPPALFVGWRWFCIWQLLIIVLTRLWAI